MDASGMITVQFNASMLRDETVAIQPFSLWYNESLTANHVTSMQVLVNETQWVWVDNDGLKQGSDGASVMVDASAFVSQGQVGGLRYAWTDILYKNPCCGDLDVNLYPCPMASCPIVTS